MHKLAYIWMIYTDKAGTDPYVEVASVLKNGSLGRKQPLDGKQLHRLILSLKNDKYKYYVGYLERQLVYVDFNMYNTKLMWLTPPGIQKLFFSMQGLRDGKYPLPPLLWIIEGGYLSMYAFKEWDGLKTELYRAPFPNTNIGICLGSQGSQYLQAASNKTVNPQRLMEAAEYAFFNTAFSHGGYGNVRTDVHKLYKALCGTTIFPLDELVPHKKLFESLVTTGISTNTQTDDDGITDEDED